MVGILVANARPILRLGIQQLLQTTSDITVEAFASSRDELLGLLPSSRTNVLVLDLGLVTPGGISLIREARCIQPGLPILALLAEPDEDGARRATKAGAKGCVTLDAAPEDLLQGIRRIAAGKTYMTPLIANALRKKVKNCPREGTSSDGLSPRQQEILCMYARGLSQASIANHLSISPKTVGTHKYRLMHKLSLKNNVDLVHYTIRHHMID